MPSRRCLLPVCLVVLGFAGSAINGLEAIARADESGGATREPAGRHNPAVTPPRPNVVWITCEDIGPHLGCYGDDDATTPHIDRFAARSLLYRHCWSNAPVCAPARTTLIMGRYATTLGAEHMRSDIRLPPGMRMYPQSLRDAGYYCTNNSKEDYNVQSPGQVWDESSPRAHWKNRPAGAPFFAVFNITTTHESQVHERRPLQHDPTKLRLRGYQPDLPEIREDWAQYYDNITRMDEEVGRRLQELENAGLADETIVWFYSDHGAGLPRNKRCPMNTGLHVPLLVHIPERFASLRPAEGESSNTAARELSRLVSFVDFAPTLLSLCGVEPPMSMQGQAFLGPHAQPARDFVFGYRGRMDERLDLVRSVRDTRYVYVRNFMPHKPYGQFVSYMYKQAGARAWRERWLARGLPAEQAAFFEPHPPEELYDLQADPDEVHNLAGRPEFRPVLDRLRGALREHLRSTRDLGLLPEAELHRRAGSRTPYEFGQDRTAFPLDRLLAAAEAASPFDAPQLEACVRNLSDSEPGVRFWGVLGLHIAGPAAVTAQAEALRPLVSDESPSVCVAAAAALAGAEVDRDTLNAALEVLAEHANGARHGLFVAVAALNAIDELDARASLLRERLPSFSEPPPGTPQKMREYTQRLVEKIAADLSASGS